MCTLELLRLKRRIGLVMRRCSNSRPRVPRQLWLARPCYADLQPRDERTADCSLARAVLSAGCVYATKLVTQQARVGRR